MRILIDDADLARALRHLPFDDKKLNKLHCNIVHHESKERFVCTPVSLEECGNYTPYRARDDSRNRHYEDEHAVRHLSAERYHACRGSKSADEHLTLRADVPKAHTECGCYGKRNAEQHCDILQHLPYAPVRSEGGFDHRSVNADGVLARQRERYDARDKECRYDRADADEPCVPPCNGGALDYVKEGLVSLGFFSCCHAALPPFLPSCLSLS